MTRPILYSFRRCPYAMRARLGLASAQIEVELREIVLRDKAPAFLDASPKGTVPVLVLPNGRVLEESLDVLNWALGQADPEGLCGVNEAASAALIAQNDGPFKQALDRYKYHTRYDGVDPMAERQKACEILSDLDARLSATPFLMGETLSKADIAIAPFVRQFANTDRAWFDAQPWPALAEWLNGFLTSTRFAYVMPKFAKWVEGDAPIAFGADGPPPSDQF